MKKNNGGRITAVCVYCGSGEGTDPNFVKAAETLGRLFAETGIRLVYGGGSHGLMGKLARSVLAHGGRVTGIIPKFLVDREGKIEDARMEVIVTENMHQRKQIMFDQSDAFVALPGGIGTLEETVEVLTWTQIGNHTKPVLIANVSGFWLPLIELLDHMREFKFIREGLEVDPLVAYRVEDILPILHGEMEGRASMTCGNKRNEAVLKNL